MIAQWPIEDFDKLPLRVFEDVESALSYSYGERDLSHVIMDLMEGTKQIWMLSDDTEFKSTVVTQIVEHPGKKICELIYLGGDDMLDMIPELTAVEDWAKENGCSDFHAIGRPGWERVLKKHGYSKRYVTVGREL